MFDLIITIGLSVLQLSALCAAAFIEVPISQNVSLGEMAEFRCRHDSADVVVWRVNGSLISSANPPSGITHGFISGGSKLTIVGRPEYDGIEVVCVAGFDNGSPDESTNPPAILGVSITTIVTTTETTTAATTDPMSGFDETPVSLTVPSGAESHFRCRHPNSDGIIVWRINGALLKNLPDNLRNLIQVQDQGEALTVLADPQLNMSSISCVAVFIGGTDIPAPPVTLKIQGLLEAVNQLRKEGSTLSWDPPFSLNLTNVEPDIAYCVEVYNITCGGRELVFSDCNVTENSYTSDAIDPDGYIYEYIVTPRSNVQGAQNGIPSQPLRGSLPTFQMYASQLSIVDDDTRFYSTVFILNETDWLIPPSSSFNLSLHSLDGLGDIYSPEMEIERIGNFMTLYIVSGLQPDRLWECTIIAHGCQDITVLSGTIIISTHDIQNVSVSSPQPGEVRVTGDFINGSTATGVLTVYVDFSTSEIFYHLIKRGNNKQQFDDTIQGVVGGEHSISFFVVKESGLPFNRTASTPKVVTTENGNVGEQLFIEYSLESTSSGVCITCTFLDSSAFDCVAVVHQRISQLSSSGLTNIESSHKFTRSGDTASGCIEGINMDNYQVGVIGGKQVSSTLSRKSCFAIGISCITGLVFGVVVSILVVLLLVISVFVYSTKKAKQARSSPEVTVEMKRCAAYEITTLAGKKVVMEANPAYEQVTMNVSQ